MQRDAAAVRRAIRAFSSGARIRVLPAVTLIGPPPERAAEVQMIGPREMTSRTIAIAEPKPTRLASPMMLLVTSTDSSSSPLSPWLMT